MENPALSKPVLDPVSLPRPHVDLVVARTEVRPLHLPFALPLLYLSLRIPDDKVEVGNIKSNSKLRLVLPEGSTSISWGP